MKVILKQDIKGTGKAGDIINVSDGYAKNFLLKKELAVEADTKSLDELKNKQSSEKYRLDLKKEELSLIAKTIDGKEINILAKSGKNGKLFGSVTSKEIAVRIKEKFNINLDKRKISLNCDIKSYGTFVAEIKFIPEITARVNVIVTDSNEKK